jgi:hypothetical protein
MILCAAAAAQAWVSIIPREGDQRANALVRSPDGSLTAAGRETRPGTWRGDLLLIHTDSLGRELWRRTVGTKRGDEEAYALLALDDAGYLAAGGRYRDKWRVKDSVTGLIQAFSLGGEATWSREIPGVVIRAAIRFQGGILLGGYRRAPTHNGWLCLMDTQGVTRWTRDLYPADSSRVDALAALSDSTFVLAGQWKGAADQHCAGWCAVADAAGGILHENRCGSPVGFFRAVVIQGGSITCAGGIIAPKDATSDDIDSFVWRADLQCQPLDSLRCKGRSLDDVDALSATDSTLVGAGVTAIPGRPGARPGVLLFSLTPDLKIRWWAPRDGVLAGAGMALVLAPEGFIVAGSARLDPEGDADVLLLHASAAGLVEARGDPVGQPSRREKP